MTDGTPYQTSRELYVAVLPLDPIYQQYEGSLVSGSDGGNSILSDGIPRNPDDEEADWSEDNCILDQEIDIDQGVPQE